MSALLHRRNLWRTRGHRSIADAASAALRSSPDVVGIDLFDTIVVRRLANEEAPTYIAAERLVTDSVWPGTPREFVDAVHSGRERSGRLDIDAWLADLAREHAIDVDLVRQTFLEAEKELLRPVPGAREALGEIREHAPVVFVSDMHLPSEDLRGLLEPLGVVEQADTLVSSSDVGQSKADGNLFTDEALSSLRSAHRASFIGNDVWSDVTQAERASLIATPATGANLTRYEEAIAGRSHTVGTAIAGAARQQRLHAVNAPGRDNEIRALGGQIMGQSLTAFLLWIRKECQARGIDEVVFLARDGELALRVARAMPSDHWDDMNLRYLHCGRRSWSLAAAPRVGVEEWISVGTMDDGSFLLHSSTTTPFANLLQRCGLTCDTLHTTSFAEVPTSLPLSAEQTVQWRELLRSGTLDDPILKAAQRANEDLVDFLTQSDFPRRRVALVDVGWRGSQAWLMSALIRQATDAEPLHLHFGGDKVISELESRVEIARFAFDDSVLPHPLSSPVACLEMFVASGAPRLVGYARDVHGIVSEVFEDSGTSVDNPTRRLAAEGAVEVGRLLPTRSEMESWGLTDCALVNETRQLLARFWTTPSAEEAALLSGLRFEGDDGGALVGPVLCPYAPTELLGRHAQPRIWREGSLALTPTWFRAAVRSYFRIRKAIAERQADKTSDSTSTALDPARR